MLLVMSVVEVGKGLDRFPEFRNLSTVATQAQ